MRAAIWSGDAWVELTVDVFESVEHPTGKTVAILAQLVNGQITDAVTQAAPMPCAAPPDCELQREINEAGGFGGTAPPPSWGGTDPKDDLPAEPPYLFTLKLEDGTEVLNQSTMKGGSVEGAMRVVLATWGAMAGDRPGKGCTEAVFQPDGRVGEDQPVAPVDEGEPAKLFRWSAAEFTDEMETVEECETRAELLGILQERAGFEALTAPDIGTQYLGQDERNNWNTWAVTVRGHGVGFVDGPI